MTNAVQYCTPVLVYGCGIVGLQRTERKRTEHIDPGDCSRDCSDTTVDTSSSMRELNSMRTVIASIRRERVGSGGESDTAGGSTVDKLSENRVERCAKRRRRFSCSSFRHQIRPGCRCRRMLLQVCSRAGARQKPGAEVWLRAS
jgi:hypothetical protein